MANKYFNPVGGSATGNQPGPGISGSATGDQTRPSNSLTTVDGVLVPADEMLTKEELAARLKVAVRTLENWQHDGLIPFLKISNVILFYWPDVVKHLQKNYTVCRRP